MDTIPYVRAIGLELKRGLSERRFWFALGAVLCYLLLESVVAYLFPFTLFFQDTIQLGIFGCNIPTRTGLFRTGLTATLFVSFFPFFAVLAYGHSKIDDRKNRYDMQLVSRMGFFKYFISKAVSTGLLGALFCGAVPAIFAVMIELLFERNIFFKDAVAYFAGGANPEENIHTIYFYGRELAVFRGYWQYALYVTLMLFLTGLVYAFLGYVVSLFIENRVLFYAFPVLFLQFWDRMVALASSVYRASHGGKYSGRLGYLFLKESMPGCENLSYVCTLGIILMVSVFIAVWSYPGIEKKYREGAGI